MLQADRTLVWVQGFDVTGSMVFVQVIEMSQNTEYVAVVKILATVEVSLYAYSSATDRYVLVDTFYSYEASATSVYVSDDGQVVSFVAAGVGVVYFRCNVPYC